jgi:hypothetical protein
MNGNNGNPLVVPRRDKGLRQRQLAGAGGSRGVDLDVYQAN